MRKQGKKYVEASKKVDRNNAYTYQEAIKLVKETAVTKFDSSVEIAMNLNIDSKKADQQIRSSIVLPNGTGKTSKVLVIVDGDDAKKCEKAGADFVGADEMIEKIEKENWFDYDTIVATPKMMPKLGRLGKILGPKGLMPNPKTNTVSATPDKVVEDIKKGMVEFRADDYGNVHCLIGKASFNAKSLEENLAYFVKSINNLKPQSVKGEYIKNISISSTMGPGIKVDKNSFDI